MANEELPNVHLWKIRLLDIDRDGLIEWLKSFIVQTGKEINSDNGQTYQIAEILSVNLHTEFGLTPSEVFEMGIKINLGLKSGNKWVDTGKGIYLNTQTVADELRVGAYSPSFDPGLNKWLKHLQDSMRHNLANARPLEDYSEVIQRLETELRRGEKRLEAIRHQGDSEDRIDIERSMMGLDGIERQLYGHRLDGNGGWYYMQKMYEEQERLKQEMKAEKGRQERHKQIVELEQRFERILPALEAAQEAAKTFVPDLLLGNKPLSRPMAVDKSSVKPQRNQETFENRALRLGFRQHRLERMDLIDERLRDGLTISEITNRLATILDTNQVTERTVKRDISEMKKHPDDFPNTAQRFKL